MTVKNTTASHSTVQTVPDQYAKYHDYLPLSGPMSTLIPGFKISL